MDRPALNLQNSTKRKRWSIAQKIGSVYRISKELYIFSWNALKARIHYYSQSGAGYRTIKCQIMLHLYIAMWITCNYNGTGRVFQYQMKRLGSYNFGEVWKYGKLLIPMGHINCIFIHQWRHIDIYSLNNVVSQVTDICESWIMTRQSSSLYVRICEH